MSFKMTQTLPLRAVWEMHWCLTSEALRERGQLRRLYVECRCTLFRETLYAFLNGQNSKGDISS